MYKVQKSEFDSAYSAIESRSCLRLSARHSNKSDDDHDNEDLREIIHEEDPVKMPTKRLLRTHKRASNQTSNTLFNRKSVQMSMTGTTDAKRNSLDMRNSMNHSIDMRKNNNNIKPQSPSAIFESKTVQDKLGASYESKHIKQVKNSKSPEK